MGFFESETERHRRVLEENQKAQLKSSRAQLDAQLRAEELSRAQYKQQAFQAKQQSIQSEQQARQFEQQTLQHEQLMALQREQASQAQRAQWASWIQTENGKRYLAWEMVVEATAAQASRAIDTVHAAWNREFERADGPSKVLAFRNNQWIGTPIYKNFGIWAGILAFLVLCAGLLMGFGPISTLLLLVFIGGGAFCVWKHTSEWVPANDAERRKSSRELTSTLGFDVFAYLSNDPTDVTPSWPDVLQEQSSLINAMERFNMIMESAGQDYPTSLPAVPVLSAARPQNRWPASVLAAYATVENTLTPHE